MAALVKRYPRTRSSKVVCQEKFACDDDSPEAKFVCDTCGTVQCASCESKLHAKAKFAVHDRRLITPPPANRLCQLDCLDKNYADITCLECSKNYCAPCFDKIHNTYPKKSHRKSKFNPNVISKTFAESPCTTPPKEFFDAPSPSDAIQTCSPIAANGLEDESLTYFTMPQTDDNSTMHHQRNGKANVKTKKVDLFAEDPTWHEEEHQLNLPFSVGNGVDIAKSSSQPSSGNEDSDPESLRQSSVGNNDIYETCESFLLVDQYEIIQVDGEEHFFEKLRCDRDDQVKVISIFGNTGDGKSHTLNHTFFGGKEVFLTSSSPMSCTTGVWAAFDPVHNAIVIDTEGLLGVSPNHNQRTRLLLKVLAISDIVIYRSRAERLHNDLFQFLADASNAYSKHFTEELRAASRRNQMNIPLSTLGPVALVFHETHHTEILGKNSKESADELLRKRFETMELSVQAFSSVHYVGTQTPNPPTDFRALLLAVKSKLNDTSVRSARKSAIVFQALQVLNEKFSGDIDKLLPETFPDQYFTCRVKCLSCSAKCCERVNHTLDEVPHCSNSRCSFRHEYENKIFLCKACFRRGHENVVVPKTSSSRENSWMGIATYAWSGYVLECPECGVIYRSRQYWYGNQDPDKSAVHTEIRHVWPGSNPVLQGTHNAARRMLDGFQYMSETIASVGAKPTKMVTNWLTDQIAPPYWVPNAQITNCHSCKKKLSGISEIHHCRACGQGFCDDCSSKQKRVPERGWGDLVVRVCDGCFAGDGTMTDSTDSNSDPKQLVPRRVGEVVGNTVGTVASLVNYPLDVIRDTARPQYWVPDADIKECFVCSSPFGVKLRIHHCRCCGQGVCDSCSRNNRKVASRGWDYPVRVCKKCNRKHGDL